MTREEAIAVCKRQSADGADADAVMGFFRTSGFSKVDSIAILMDGFSLNLGQAKELVHFSAAWRDTRSSDEAFHEAVIDAVAEMPGTEMS